MAVRAPQRAARREYDEAHPGAVYSAERLHAGYDPFHLHTAVWKVLEITSRCCSFVNL